MVYDMFAPFRKNNCKKALRMKVEEEVYCSVCFKIAENEYEVIDNGTRVILQVLSIELNWDSSKERFLCQECADMAKKSYNFKLVSSDSINRYWVKRNILKREQGAESRKSTETDILEEFTKCTLCRSRVKSDKVLSIDVLLNDPNIMELYPQCMADIDLADLKGAMVCMSCKENFEGYFNFVRNYLNVKENVKTNFKKEIFNGDSNQEKLKLFETTIKFPISTEIGEVKQELVKFEGYTGLEVQYESLEYQEVNIKDETVIVKIEDGDRKENGFEPIVANLQMQSHNLKHDLDETLTKHNISTYENQTQIFRCASCTFKSKQKEELENHTLTHKNPSEQCKTLIRLPDTTVHDLRIYKCDICTFECKRKNHLKNHILSHKSKSELTTFKCDNCAFETKRKCDLTSHMVTHKGKSEVKTFKCYSCTFEFKRRSGLNRHILCHKSKSDVNTYKCDSCPFESKSKHSLKNHFVTHKSMSELETFKCSSCPFECKRKDGLKKHFLTHKSKCEVETFKCESCMFESKHKSVIRRHFLSHKSKSEVKTFKCESCTFETKYKNNLKTHILTHKSKIEVLVHKFT